MNGNIFFELFLSDLDEKITFAGTNDTQRETAKQAYLARNYIYLSLSIRLFFLAGYEKEATGKEKPDTTVFILVFHLLIA